MFVYLGSITVWHRSLSRVNRPSWSVVDGRPHPGNLKDGLGFGQPKELRLLGSRLPGLDLLDKPGDMVAARGQPLVQAGRACVWQCDVLATSVRHDWDWLLG